MPILEEEDYLIHYSVRERTVEIVSVEVFAEAKTVTRTDLQRCWVWADSLPDNVRDYVYNEAYKILETKL